jgi:hypothetical protein
MIHLAKLANFATLAYVTILVTVNILQRKRSQTANVHARIVLEASRRPVMSVKRVLKISDAVRKSMPPNVDASTEPSHDVKRNGGKSRTTLVRSSCVPVEMQFVSLTNIAMLTKAYAVRSPLYPVQLGTCKSSALVNVMSSNALLANTATVLCLVADA